ncbi:hypothetical protein HYH02_005820 [Chlamydomonas schloesseri]|uniref:DEAD/DEAH box helicase n=1 Tax=Chlamydomonas schloesseri TaxID=2026947 RepID=A0A835WL66_9CHLO|nr:hypothetical protein HYH02_005820 [Chlamydomonas schloesseri]|eukprot:KAG2449071.1 hypothetical protein HYH02_005820 [Chlamydomonas schloesseri]
MLSTRSLLGCLSTCSTSGRDVVLVGPSQCASRGPRVRTHAGGGKATSTSRKLTGGGKPFSPGPPETIVTNYPRQLDDVAVGTDTLASVDSESEPDVELLLPDSLDVIDATSTVDEPNPYTSEDALSAPREGLGGEPALEALLAEAAAAGGNLQLSASRITSIFPFPLDGFQRRALELFLEGQSVVVCAPTGAGKTAIAEAAAVAALARGQRVIYTTPLKALSNQKLFETRRRFGHARCGLQTGDANLNPDADIVVMTTEILRNIMYRTAELAEENNTGSMSTREARLGNVGLIVLDEVHYLGDPHRGSVWEEVIINCPRHIQLLCMSATVANPQDLGDWIAQEHMPCETIQTRFRPVPLHWHFAHFRASKGVVMDDLLVPISSARGGDRGDRGGGSKKVDGKGALSSTKQMLNPRLSTQKVLQEEARIMLAKQGPPPFGGPGRGGGRSGGGGPGGGRGGAWRSSSSSRGPEPAFDWEQEFENLMEKDAQALRRRVNLRRIPDMHKTIKLLAQREMLPAIWFILSRRDCDSSAARAAAVPLTDADTQAAIAAEVAALRADQPEAVKEELVPALISGIASHHAGQLPGWKSLVERLFQRGLLKLVFATGTLAAGINMPARTTVVSSLSRMTDEGPKLLPHNELLQMAGRAGRRGYDTEGNCLVLQNKFEGADEAWQIIRAGPEPLVSQFSVSYGLVLNLLSVNTLEQAKEFVSRSFGNFLATEGNRRREAEAEALEKEAQQLVEAFKASATSRAKELNAELKAAKDELKRLKNAQIEAQCESARNMLAADGLPRIVVLNLAAGGGGGGNGRPLLMPALVVGEVDPPPEVAAEGSTVATVTTAGPYYACLAADNRLMRASVACVAGVLAGPAGAVTEADADKVWGALEGLRSNAWSNVEAGSWALQAALGTPTTSAVTRQLGARLPWTFVEADAGVAAQVLAARQAVKAAVAALEEQRRQAASSSSRDGSLEQMARAKRLLKKADKLRAEGKSGGRLEATWKTFQLTMEILICMDALEPESLRVLPLGLLARNIQGGNELWLAMALSHPALHALTGPQLAALLGALISPEVLSKPTAVWAAYPVSPAVEAAVEALEEQRQLLVELQADAGLTRWNDALLVDLRFAGLVEAWASGATWAQVMEDSNMDDGDMARLLIRTIDLLKQLQHNAHLLPELKDAAAEALRGMDRKPVAELTF